jgi:hypothetical protein
MARTYATVAFTEQVESSPGVWKNKITTRHYAGKIVRDQDYIQDSQISFDNIKNGNSLSLIYDQYMIDHSFDILYAMWNNIKFSITSITIEKPRMILQLGGVYNGVETGTSDSSGGDADDS